MNRMFEIIKLVAEKQEQLQKIDIKNDPIQYQKISEEIVELKMEMEDLKHIGTAVLTAEIEEKDKNILILENLIDFNKLETEDYLKLAEMQKFEKEINKEIDDVNTEIKKYINKKNK